MNTSIKKKLTGIVGALMLAVATLVVPVVVPTSAYAVDTTCDSSNIGNPGTDTNSTLNGVNCAKGAGTPSTLFGTNSIFTTVVNVMLFIIGAICVIMLIWGGIRYTTSAGNSASVTSAKNTIMYAIIGLIIAFLAFAIVNWVLSSIGTAA
ncbi:MAG: pilin [Candidatus Saccharimonadaceae bacterium]